MMLKKFSKARGEAVFMEGVTQGHRLGLSKRRRQERGQHPQGNHPHRMGPHPGRGRGKGHPDTQVPAGRRGRPVSLASQAQGSLVQGENKQTHHGARWHPFG